MSLAALLQGLYDHGGTFNRSNRNLTPLENDLILYCPPWLHFNILQKDGIYK